MNIKRATQTLEQLAGLGVQTICLCPGGRNAPFVKLLANQKDFEVISFFDERSAGFFALGRARRDQAPVVVCTTSGTAVSELLSSVIEAHYSNTPIIVLSADRPKRLRGSGAPQTIEQAQIFNPYIDQVWDLDNKDSLDLSCIGTKPIHINLCFDEPLIDSDDIKKKFQIEKPKNSQSQKIENSQQLENMERPLIVVGALKPEQRQGVEAFLNQVDVPIFVESLSGLKNSLSLKEKRLLSGERIVTRILQSGEVQSVLRLGDIPVGRYWRDLDKLSLPVFCFSDKNLTGLERGQVILSSLESISLQPQVLSSWDWSSWLNQDRQQTDSFNELLLQFPLSEVALLKKMGESIKSSDQVYLGNSLPVRLWDLINADHAQVFASRGVNGIDGQLSTAFGLHKQDTRTWAILGDLTTLYDMSGFWLGHSFKHENFNLLVINNKGGQIFSRMFSDPLFRNEHQLEFKKLAEMWGWNYQLVEDEFAVSDLSGLNLIEVQPSIQQTNEFWQRYDQLWNK